MIYSTYPNPYLFDLFQYIIFDIVDHLIRLTQSAATTATTSRRLYFHFLGNLRDEARKARSESKKLERKHEGMALEEERFLKKREYDELRKKALECMQAVAVSLPGDMELLTMNFNDRKESNQNLSVTGSVPTDLDELVATFKDQMVSIEVKDAEENDIRLFANVLEGSIVEIPIRGDPKKRWSLNCSLVMNREKRRKDK